MYKCPIFWDLSRKKWKKVEKSSAWGKHERTTPREIASVKSDHAGEPSCLSIEGWQKRIED
jgi:hypothetical protein